jgi:hypothetical protein
MLVIIEDSPVGYVVGNRRPTQNFNRKGIKALIYFDGINLDTTLKVSEHQSSMNKE